MSIKMYCTVDEFNNLRDKFNSDELVELFGKYFFIQSMSSGVYYWNSSKIEVDVNLVEAQKTHKPKTSEQILAEERYTHYKAKMEAAKKDMEYWEERL